MDALTLTAENGVLGHLFGTPFTVTAPIKVALMTEMGDDLTLGTEVTGGSYARQTFTPTLASGGYVYNSTSVTFALLPACEIVGMEIWDSADHRLWHGPFLEPLTVPAGETISFAPSAITIHMGGNFDTRTSTTVTQAIDANMNWVGTVELGRSFRVLRIECDKECRVRLHSTAAHQLADVNRPIGTLPAGDHGVILDYVADETTLAADLSPQAEGANLEFSPTADIPMTVQNRSGSNGSVSVQLTYLRLEG